MLIATHIQEVHESRLERKQYANENMRESKFMKNVQDAWINYIPHKYTLNHLTQNGGHI